MAAQPTTGSTGDMGVLTGTTWRWIGFTGPTEQVAVETPMNYSLVFQQDGVVDITADCNNAQGSYQVNEQSIKIEVGPMTKAKCPPGSRGDQCIQYLESAAIYFFRDSNLYIDLLADGSTLVFTPAQAVMTDNSGGVLSAALQANPWQWVSFTHQVEQYDVEASQNYLFTFHGDGTVRYQSRLQYCPRRLYYGW